MGKILSAAMGNPRFVFLQYRLSIKEQFEKPCRGSTGIPASARPGKSIGKTWLLEGLGMVAQKKSRPAKTEKNGVVDQANDVAEKAKNNVWIDRLTRLGYAARGLIYGLIGFLAVQVIVTGRGAITDQSGALSTIASQPFGKVLMVVVAVGLVGLLIWGIVRAIADPYRKGSDFKGLVQRAGYFISGISYGALLFPTLRLITGSPQQSGNSSQQAEQMAAGILTRPWGPWLVGLVGGVLIGVGGYRIYRGLKGRLNERFKSYDMKPEERKWAERTGRIGYVAFGLVLAIIGVLAVLAATTLDPNRVGGLDEALTFLARQPYGPWLLAAVAVGLMAYAVYSLMGARWFRIKEL